MIPGEKIRDKITPTTVYHYNRLIFDLVIAGLTGVAYKFKTGILFHRRSDVTSIVQQSHPRLEERNSERYVLVLAIAHFKSAVTPPVWLSTKHCTILKIEVKLT